MKKALLPQEIETFYIIPTIRRYITVFLKKKMKQKEIAAIFQVNSATVSQYAKKRGHQIDFDPKTINEIKKSAEKITNTLSYLKETQHLIDYIRRTKALCKIHKLLANVPEGCDPEQIGCHPRGHS